MRRLGLADFEYRNDIGVVESGSSASFLPEPSEAIRLASELFGEDFESDLAPEFCVLGEVHFTHPAGADSRQDSIVANAGSA
jgi:hypothetical protein